MAELSFLSEIAKLIQSYGLVGVVVVFIAYLFWADKQRVKQQETDRLERQKNIEADRAVLSNHLSQMLEDDTKSRENLAVGLTKLSESVNNFQNRCGQIQDDLRNEVQRLKNI